MSRTYKRTDKGYKTDWLPEICREDYDQEYCWHGIYFRPDKKKVEWVKKNPHRKSDIGNYFSCNYSKNPGWYNKMTFHVPRRAHDRDVLKKIKNGQIDPDDAFWFSYGNKPLSYY